MRQQSFSDIEYSNHRKKTKREEFLAAMDEMIPWQYWVDLIHPYYPFRCRCRTTTGTPANVHDIEETNELVREDDEIVYGDSGYSGAENREGIKQDEHLSTVEFRINIRPSSIKVPDSYQGINWDKRIENRKSSTRCKVEHPFLIVKKQFGYCKVAYGISKNLNRFHVLFASANLVMCARAGRTQEFCMV